MKREKKIYALPLSGGGLGWGFQRLTPIAWSLVLDHEKQEEKYGNTALQQVCDAAFSCLGPGGYGLEPHLTQG